LRYNITGSGDKFDVAPKGTRSYEKDYTFHKE